MNAKEFFNLVMRMREAQKKYFKTRSSLDLRQAKTLEKEIDAEIERVNALAPRKDAQGFIRDISATNGLCILFTVIVR